MAALASFLVLLLAISHAGARIHLPKHIQPTSDTCQPLPQALKTPATLPLVRRHGPCAGTPRKSPSIKDILIRDKARVAAINNKRSRSKVRTDSTDLPLNLGLPYDSEQYIVQMGIGTPTTNVALMIDTGSSLTWVQCVPCLKCFRQAGPLFDSDKSATYQNSSCTSEACDLAESDKCSSTGTCIFDIEYDDGSVTVGNLATESLAVTPSEIISGFIFGCAQENKGLFGKESGILGLGRDPLSIVSQTATTYNRVFSHCLPSSEDTTGFLSFGPRSTAPATAFQYTPISPTSKDDYGVQILGISVDGVELPIPLSVFTQAKAIIDSGTVISYLPPRAYNALREAFAARLRGYPVVEVDDLLDLCFDFRGVDVKGIVLPEVAFVFKGKTVVRLPPSGILSSVGDSVECLAFVANKKDTDLAIFGNVQQRTFEIVFDETAQRIGFAPNVCA